MKEAVKINNMLLLESHLATLLSNKTNPLGIVFTFFSVAMSNSLQKPIIAKLDWKLMMLVKQEQSPIVGAQAKAVSAPGRLQQALFMYLWCQQQLWSMNMELWTSGIDTLSCTVYVNVHIVLLSSQHYVLVACRDCSCLNSQWRRPVLPDKHQSKSCFAQWILSVALIAQQTWAPSWVWCEQRLEWIFKTQNSSWNGQERYLQSAHSWFLLKQLWTYNPKLASLLAIWLAIFFVLSKSEVVHIDFSSRNHGTGRDLRHTWAELYDSLSFLQQELTLNKASDASLRVSVVLQFGGERTGSWP